MSSILIVGLVIIAVALFVSVQKGWISDNTLQRLANIAGILALIAAAAVFIVPAPITPPKPTEVPSNLEIVDSPTPIDTPFEDKPTVVQPVNSSSKPIAVKEGSVLFETDFEDTSIGFISKQDGNWKGALDETDNTVYEINNVDNSDTRAMFLGSTNWSDYQIEFNVRILEITQGIYSKSNKMSFYFRGNPATSPTTAYDLQIDPANDELLLSFSSERTWQIIETVSFNFTPNKWYLIKVQTQGSKILVFVDEKLVIDVVDSSRAKGGIGFAAHSGIYLQIDNVKVMALEE
jgi:hypothetical protein